MAPPAKVARSLRDQLSDLPCKFARGDSGLAKDTAATASNISIGSSFLVSERNFMFALGSNDRNSSRQPCDLLASIDSAIGTKMQRSAHENCNESDTATFAAPRGTSRGGITEAAQLGIIGDLVVFTESQLRELQTQALVFRYMACGASVPANLILSVKSSLLGNYPLHTSDAAGPGLMNSWKSSSPAGSRAVLTKSLAAADAEPGRCRRTDGKKWRCARDVVPYHKYCERHIHRGRHHRRNNNNNNNNSVLPPSASDVRRLSLAVDDVGPLLQRTTRMNSLPQLHGRHDCPSNSNSNSNSTTTTSSSSSASVDAAMDYRQHPFVCRDLQFQPTSTPVSHSLSLSATTVAPTSDHRSICSLQVPLMTHGLAVERRDSSESAELLQFDLKQRRENEQPMINHDVVSGKRRRPNLLQFFEESPSVASNHDCDESASAHRRPPPNDEDESELVTNSATGGANHDYDRSSKGEKWMSIGKGSEIRAKEERMDRGQETGTISGGAGGDSMDKGAEMGYNIGERRGKPSQEAELESTIDEEDRKRVSIMMGGCDGDNETAMAEQHWRRSDGRGGATTTTELSIWTAGATPQDRGFPSTVCTTSSIMQEAATGKRAGWGRCLDLRSPTFKLTTASPTQI